jgi:hypothetical protein
LCYVVRDVSAQDVDGIHNEVRIMPCVSCSSVTFSC